MAEKVAQPADITTRWFSDRVYDEPARALRVTLDSPWSFDNIFKELEYADPTNRLGLLVGGTDENDQYQSLKLTDDGRLKVDTRISLSITELEVEIDVLDGDRIGIYGYVDGDPDSPAPINITSLGELRVVTSAGNDGKYIYNETSLASGIEADIVSYTVPLGKIFKLISVAASGHADAFFKVKKNGNSLAKKRNNWCKRNADFDFIQGLVFEAGDIVSVTALHSELTGYDFNATMYGEEA